MKKLFILLTILITQTLLPMQNQQTRPSYADLLRDLENLQAQNNWLQQRVEESQRVIARLQDEMNLRKNARLQDEMNLRKNIEELQESEFKDISNLEFMVKPVLIPPYTIVLKKDDYDRLQAKGKLDRSKTYVVVD
jgi:predicted nuclease with TOPRIM domain